MGGGVRGRGVRGLAPAVAIAALAAVAAAPQAPSAGLRRERTIPLGGVSGRIDHLSVDPVQRKLYVAALGNDTVEVVDLSAGSRTGTIRGLAEPQGVLVVPELGRVFVANRRDGTLRLFEAKTLALLATVHLGADADNLRRDADGRVWVGWGTGR